MSPPVLHLAGRGNCKTSSSELKCGQSQGQPLKEENATRLPHPTPRAVWHLSEVDPPLPGVSVCQAHQGLGATSHTLPARGMAQASLWTGEETQALSSSVLCPESHSERESWGWKAKATLLRSRLLLLQHTAFLLLPPFVSTPVHPRPSLLSSFAVFKSTLTMVTEPPGVDVSQGLGNLRVPNEGSSEAGNRTFPHAQVTFHSLKFTAAQPSPSHRPGSTQTNTFSRTQIWSFYRETGTKENQ